jgi:hypothetical protein
VQSLRTRASPGDGTAVRNVFPSDRTEAITMKRKYGAQLAMESEAERCMRERAKEMRSNRFNFGCELRKGAVTRGKRRSRADRRGL